MMTQSWHDLLFAHWPADRNHVRALVPDVFELDTFDGLAWIGVVPFHMTNVAPRGVPAVPWLSAFPEINVRTYVRVGDRPGIYFFSLDAGRWLAVQAARLLLRLPYFSAGMRVERHGDAVRFASRRSGAREATFEVTYHPNGPPQPATHGTLEHFLTERYCLYNLGRASSPYRLEIQHPPWQLQPAQARLVCNTMLRAAGLSAASTQPILHFSRRQDMVAWPPVDL
jgi:uncharacterized protein